MINKKTTSVKIVDIEMASLYKTLIKNNIPSIDGGVYMSDGLYLYPDGHLSEDLSDSLPINKVNRLSLKSIHRRNDV